MIVLAFSQSYNENNLCNNMFRLSDLKAQQRYVFKNAISLLENTVDVLLDKLSAFPQAYDPADKSSQIPSPKPTTQNA